MPNTKEAVLSGRKLSAEERKILDRAARYLPGGSNGNTIYQGLVIREGRGSRVWDLSGNEYIDYSLGSGPMILGHEHPEVVEAVRKQVGRGTTFFGLNKHAVLLAEAIVDALPCAQRVRFAGTGTEATFHAMRVARAYRGRDKILKFEGGYHGMNDYALMSMAPSEPADFPNAVPDTVGIPEAIREQVLVAPFNDIDSAASIIERHHGELGGVIVEPLQRVILPTTGFLQGLREVTQEYEVPLIFDEVVTGFRVAYGGAQEYYGVVPDLCALGKAVSGGYPLSVIAGRAEIMDRFAADQAHPYGMVLQEGTLNGNPVAAVAGLATLEVLKREGTYENLFRIGNAIKEGLKQLLVEAGIPAQVMGVPPMFDVLFLEGEVKDYRDTLRHDAEKGARFVKLLRKRGIYKNDAKFYISTAHTEKDVDETLAAFRSAIEELDSQVA